MVPQFKFKAWPLRVKLRLDIEARCFKWATHAKMPAAMVLSLQPHIIAVNLLHVRLDGVWHLNTYRTTVMRIPYYLNSQAACTQFSLHVVAAPCGVCIQYAVDLVSCGMEPSQNIIPCPGQWSA